MLRPCFRYFFARDAGENCSTAVLDAHESNTAVTILPDSEVLSLCTDNTDQEAFICAVNKKLMKGDLPTDGDDDRENVAANLMANVARLVEAGTPVKVGYNRLWAS